MPRRRRGWWIAGGLSLIVIGCQALDRTAPPVSPALEAVGQKRSIPAETLAAGREAYVSRCARCHSLEPIDKYPAQQWREQIIPDMARRSRLTPEQTAALEAYLLVAHEALNR